MYCTALTSISLLHILLRIRQSQIELNKIAQINVLHYKDLLRILCFYYFKYKRQWKNKARQSNRYLKSQMMGEDEGEDVAAYGMATSLWLHFGCPNATSSEHNSTQLNSTRLNWMQLEATYSDKKWRRDQPRDEVKRWNCEWKFNKNGRCWKKNLGTAECTEASQSTKPAKRFGFKRW